ncbi:MAG: DUF4412 domain-containing protein [Syntrophobacteraceae bacterium]
MKAGKRVFFAGLLAVASVFFACPARADLFWQTRSVSVHIDSQPNGSSIQKYYFTPYAMRVDLGAGQVIIVRYKTMKLYRLDTAKRTWTQIDLAGAPEIAGIDQKDLSQMLGAVMGTDVFPTNKYRTISGYRCREYFVRIAIVNGEYWVSRDVPGYRELEAAGEEAGAIAQCNPVFRRIDIPGLVRKLGGFPVRTVNHILGGTITSTLTKIEQKRLNPTLFEVPPTYKAEKTEPSPE